MKKIFFLLLFFCAIGSVYGQNLQVKYATCTGCHGNNPQYGVPTAFETNQISSDYGMRVADGTRFHQGIDYAGPVFGSGIASIEGGPGIGANGQDLRASILRISVTNGLKYVIMRGEYTFAYLHIFENGNEWPMRNSGFVLDELPNNNGFCIINIASGVAYAQIAGLNVNYMGQNYTTTNRVSQDELFAPIGNSAANNAHLHVSLLENNATDFNSATDCIDPWNVVTHPNNALEGDLRTRRSNNFNLVNCEHDQGEDAWGTLVPRYDNNTRNILEAQVSMPGAVMTAAGTAYTNVCMDEDKIEIQIKKQNENIWSKIKGSMYESYFQIDPQGNNQIHPARMNGSYGGLNVQEMGCFPTAYRNGAGGFGVGAGHPHDFYLFPDFYLRIKNDHTLGNAVTLANYPWDARYPDGMYQLRTNISDVDGNVYAQNPLNFPIDNFKPFVREVGVNFEQVGVTAYWTKWLNTTRASEMSLLTRMEGGVPDINTCGPLTVYAIASEKMQDMSAEIPDLNTGIVNGAEFDPAINKWKFSFGNVSNQLYYDQCLKIRFRGHDVGGNEVLDFQIDNPTPPTYCNWGINKRVRIPKRTGANSWDANTPSGIDEVHRFRIKECGSFFQSNLTELAPPDCMTLAESITNDVYFTDVGQSNGAIVLTIPNLPQGTTIQWFDAAKNDIGQTGNIASHLAPGDYCYELQYECCTLSDCFTIGECDLTVTGNIFHATSPDYDNGKIMASGMTENPSVVYLWSNGKTTSTIDKLVPGIYTVTVTDGVHCISTKVFEILSCSDIQVNTGTIITNPSACNSNDGSIRLLSGPGASGGVSPYSYSWIDSDGNLLTPSSTGFYNLSPGQYFCVATDANGCTGSKVFLLIPDHFPIVSDSVSPACTGLNNGQIEISAIDPMGGSYNFEWDNDMYDLETDYSAIEQLYAGEYCVTVTSVVNGCSFIKCYVVDELLWGSPLELSTDIIKPCPRQANGNINLFVSGGAPPYNFNWNDITGVYEPSNRQNLAGGIYTVTITDYCGSSIVTTIDLEDIGNSFEVVTIPGCDGQGGGSAVVYVTGGNPSFTYKWSVPGQNQSTIQNLSQGNYSVTVTDSKGCSISKTFFLKNRSYYINKTKPCQGTSDGSAEFVMSNPPNSGYYKLEFNNTELFEINFGANTETVVVPDLPPGENFAYKVTLNECVFTGIVNLASRPTEKRFVDFSDGACIYQEYCDGLLLAPGEFLYGDPKMVPAEDGNCSFDLLCGATKVGQKSVDKITVRVAEFLEILAAATNFGIVPTGLPIETLENQPPCKRVKYCPLTMEFQLLPSFLGVNGNLESIGDGCFDLNCGFLGLTNSDFCVDDILPNDVWNLLGTGGNILSGCKVVKKNFYQMIKWADQLEDKYGTLFTNSELFQWINTHAEDNRAICADIYFCENDFSVLSAPNFLEAVYCGDYPDWAPPSHDCWGPYWPGDNNPTPPCAPYLCLDPVGGSFIINENTTGTGGPITGDYVYICDNFPGGFFQDPTIDSRNMLIDSDPGYGVGFGYWVYPNPSSDVFNIMINAELVGDLSIIVTDIDGKIVYMSDLPNVETTEIQYQLKLDVPDGLYILSVKNSSGFKKSTKIAKMR
jgi:hypothetical protein